MRRVMKSEVVVEKFIKGDGLEYCLACYKDYMQLDDRDLSESKMLLRGGDEDDKDGKNKGYESDPYGDQRKADKKIGEATHNVIEQDLTPQHAWAIKKLMGIATVWKFPLLNFMSAAIEAKKQLEIKLRKNFDTAHKFG